MKRLAVQSWWIYAAPMTVTAALRLWLFRQWWLSPFREYAQVPGLDMRKYIWWTEEFVRGQRSFSLYYFLNAPGLMLFGRDGMIVTQLILGVSVAGLVTFVALRLYGQRLAAMLAGLLAGLYAPTLMYELFHLREGVYLFSATLSLALLLQARRRHFTTPWTVAAAAAAALPPMVRFSGLLWTAMALSWLILAIRRREIRRPHLALVADPKRRAAWLRPSAQAVSAMIAAMGLVAIFNLALGHQPFPFGSGISGFHFRTTVAPQDVPATDPEVIPENQPRTPPAPSLDHLFKAYLDKAWLVVQAVEVPNNLNYYFVREQLSILRLAPGPMLILPWAFAGLAWLLWRRPFGHAATITIAYFLAFAIPMIVFLPLARYRLVMVPAFALWCAYPAARLLRARKWSAQAPAIIVFVLLLALLVRFLAPRGDFPIRVADYLAYAQAMSRCPGHDRHQRLAALLLARQLDPESRPAAYALAEWHLEHGEFIAARDLLLPIAVQPTADRRLRLACVAALLGNGQTDVAGEMLADIPPDDDPQYFYQFGEYHRLQGRPDDAAAAFRTGLAASRHERQYGIFRQALARLGHQPEPHPAPTTDAPTTVNP